MSPYFSLILPIYNVEPYLERCIRSILEQDYEDYEIILVDDGSKDGSALICDQYADKNAKIRVIHKQNGGLSSARNAGLEIAGGRYVWWIDSDDWIEAGALRTLYQASCTENPDIVKFSHYRAEKASCAVQSNAEAGLYRGKEIDRILDKAFFSAGQFGLSAWTCIYRRAFLQEEGVQFISERIVGSEDYLFNLLVFPRASKMRVLPVCLYHYFMREGSLTQRYKKQLPEQYTEMYRQLIGEYRRMEVPEEYLRKVSFFYVWHLMRGTCMTNEYCAPENHSLKDGRKNVRRFMRKDEFRAALDCCDKSRLSKKNKILFWAMKRRMEYVFYYLYAVKPRLKRSLGV